MEMSVVRLTDHPGMTIAVDWDVEHQMKRTKTVFTCITQKELSNLVYSFMVFKQIYVKLFLRARRKNAF